MPFAFVQIFRMETANPVDARVFTLPNAAGFQ
jgi:hypothetical protein